MKKLVFFSGGTALGQLASHLAARGAVPVYIITTFDSGGSTQALRKVLPLPAVGDLRNRLLAATDSRACPMTLVQFLKSRLRADQSFQEGRQDLRSRIRDAAPGQYQQWDEIRTDLETFLANMPAAFDARRASMGNIALAGNWLANGRSLEAALARYCGLLQVRAKLIPVCEQNLHLGFHLANGQTLIGQHLLHDDLPAPVTRIFLTSASPWIPGDAHDERRPAATAAALAAIANADILCFPMGSFFSSLLATLLPAGIGQAIAGSRAIKVYIPNSGYDIELSRLDLVRQINRLLGALESDAPGARPERLLNAVVLDSVNGQYQLEDFNACACHLATKGIRVHDRRVIGAEGRHDPAKLLAALEELA